MADLGEGSEPDAALGNAVDEGRWHERGHVRGAGSCILQRPRGYRGSLAIPLREGEVDGRPALVFDFENAQPVDDK
jgi:hypothetical protein